jgi:catechol 2,3-dioxygenase-like lactoylglutathione lyase family enzyme
MRNPDEEDDVKGRHNRLKLGKHLLEYKLWILVLILVAISWGCDRKQEKKDMVSIENLNVQANLVFLYYKDLAVAEDFYKNTLGLEMVLDYGFAKLLRISKTTYVGLVDETKGMHRATEPKTVTLSFVTEEIDGWYDYLKDKCVEMRGELGDATRHPTRGFVAYDPEGYYLEFERFLDHSQNTKLLKRMSQFEPVYRPEGLDTPRPKSLGIQANIIWLYYIDLDEAQSFYEDILGLELVTDQGFAKVYACSSTGYIGLVDEAQGLHRFSEEKSVTVSFISTQIDEWYSYLAEKKLTMREELTDGESISVRTFVTFDVAGYFLEFDRFLEEERNTKILYYLR